MGQKSARSRDRSSHRSATISRKEQLRETGQIREAEPKKYYHWNDEPDNISLIINVSSVRSIVEREMARCGAVITYSFLIERGLRSIYYGMKKGNVNMYVKTLKRFCKAFNIDLNWIEQNGVILGPYAYPIDMSSKGFVRLKTHVLNEGRVLFVCQPRSSTLKVFRKCRPRSRRNYKRGTALRYLCTGNARKPGSRKGVGCLRPSFRKKNNN